MKNQDGTTLENFISVLNEVILGSSVAFAIFVVCVFCLFQMLIPPLPFAGTLALWILYSGYRLFKAVVKPCAGGRTLAFWIAALASSFVVIVLSGIVVTHIRLFP